MALVRPMRILVSYQVHCYDDINVTVEFVDSPSVPARWTDVWLYRSDLVLLLFADIELTFELVDSLALPARGTTIRWHRADCWLIFPLSSMYCTLMASSWKLILSDKSTCIGLMITWPILNHVLGIPFNLTHRCLEFLKK